MKNKYQKFNFAPRLILPDRNNIRFAENVTEICDRFCFVPELICQIGAATDDELEYLKFINQGSRALLFEPNDYYFKKLKEKYSFCENIAIYNIGIWMIAGKFKFYNRGHSTFLNNVGIPPAVVNDEYVRDEKDSFLCECANIRGFDNGKIDLLMIDAEGVEWICLQSLISLPSLICLETHNIHHKTFHPQYNSIINWMDIHNYLLCARNESDSVFLNSSFFEAVPRREIEQENEILC